MFFICVRLLNCGIGCFIGEGVGFRGRGENSCSNRTIRGEIRPFLGGGGGSAV